MNIASLTAPVIGTFESIVGEKVAPVVFSAREEAQERAYSLLGRDTETQNYICVIYSEIGDQNIIEHLGFAHKDVSDSQIAKTLKFWGWNVKPSENQGDFFDITLQSSYVGSRQVIVFNDISLVDLSHKEPFWAIEQLGRFISELKKRIS